MRFDLTRTFRFEAAHRLPHLPPGHKCARLHGHSFRVDVTLHGPLDPTLGWVVDFGDIKAAAQPVFDLLDHRYLNDITGLDNPTSEVLCLWLWERLAPALPGLHAIRVRETCNASCTYRGPGKRGD
jgi:6-pyruvoyltetrahydropterin/6-carboxytetrahydropterin synthase